jgi:FkbM family methyltransferase
MTPVKRHLRPLRRAIEGAREIRETEIVFSLLADGERGLLLDVGAHHGDTLMPFAGAGWDVIAFEPDTANRAVLEQRVAGMPNVTVNPYAVSDRAGILPLFASAQSTGVSSLTPFTPGHEHTEQVQVVTLADSVSGVVVDRPVVLKIDVEGWEKRVLDGLPWDTLRPTAAIVEFEDAKTRELGYAWDDLAREFADRGYAVLISEWRPVERYGGRHRWRRFARFPGPLADVNAWGNLIAVEPPLFPRLVTIARRRAAAYRLLERMPIR